jgi:beta-lactamase regulating signal transducer with metallopeptidase domain
VECFVTGAVLALLAAVLLRLLPRQNSGTRFAVWFSVLLGVAVLPLFASSRLMLGHADDLPAHSVLRLPASWALYTFALWALVAGVLLLRIALALWQIRTLRATATVIHPADLPSSLQELFCQSGSKRAVAICRSDRVRVPMAVGLFKPAVLLPSWLLQEMSADELRQVLVHELAHLRRRDDWTNLAQKLLRALLFFHPAVWWIEQRVSLEREMACDDLVLAETGNPQVYAECLAKLAERSLVRRSIALAQAAVSRVRHTTLRVMRLLDPSHPHATTISKPALSVVAMVLAAGVFFLARQPDLVSFSAANSIARSAVPLPAGVDGTAPLIPAALAPRMTEAHPILAKATLNAPRPGKSTAPSKLHVPKPLAGRGGRPLLLEAKAPGLAPCQVTNAVFVVIEPQRSVSDAPVIWQVLVWRVTVVRPADLVPQKQT